MVRAKLHQLLLLMALISTACTGGHAQTLQPSTFRTKGHPVATLVAPDGQHLLVTEDGADGDAHSRGAAGIEVFQISGHMLKSERFVRISGEPQGMVLVPGTRTLAFGMDEAVGFVDLDAVLTGDAKPFVVAFGKKAGAQFLAASPNGRFLFTTVEYGDGGEVAVIALGFDKASGQVNAATIRVLVPTPRATPGLVLSADGARLYVVSEVALDDARLAGQGQPDLDRADCHQGASGLQRNGVLYTFDAAALERLSAEPDVKSQNLAPASISQIASGCSPVRLVLSADGSRLYVTARGENKVLVFDARKLETDPDQALVHAFPSGGEAPVGLQLAGGGKRLVVANSNRFNGTAGDIAVLDAETGQIVHRFKAGIFPRNVEVAPGGLTYVTDFVSNAVEVLTPDVVDSPSP